MTLNKFLCISEIYLNKVNEPVNLYLSKDLTQYFVVLYTDFCIEDTFNNLIYFLQWIYK
jgi:hypothetical protein